MMLKRKKRTNELKAIACPFPFFISYFPSIHQCTQRHHYRRAFVLMDMHTHTLENMSHFKVNAMHLFAPVFVTFISFPKYFFFITYRVCVHISLSNPITGNKHTKHGRVVKWNYDKMSFIHSYHLLRARRGKKINENGNENENESHSME